MKFVVNLITRTEDGGFKFNQPVLIQSLEDEFELPQAKFTAPAMAGDMLTKCDEKNLMSAVLQTKYRSGKGKLMHLMQYFCAEIYNSVRDLARHMTGAATKHMDQILRVMKYGVGQRKRGLVLSYQMRSGTEIPALH